jgi:hypothetical protein
MNLNLVELLVLQEEDARLALVYEATQSTLKKTAWRLDERRNALHEAKWNAEKTDLFAKVNVLKARQDAICEARETMRREETRRKREAWTALFNKNRRLELIRQQEERKNKNLGVPLPKFVKSRLSTTLL